MSAHPGAATGPRRTVRGTARRTVRRVVRRERALVVPAPEVDPVLAAWRGPNPGDLGAHVTVMFPFVTWPGPGPRLRHSLQALAGGVPPFDYTLPSLGAFPGVHYLAPQPAEPFLELTERVMARWPRQQPYEGAFETVVPHLTVAIGPAPAPLDQLENALPLRARATTLQLLERSGRRWRLRGEWRLGGASC